MTRLANTFLHTWLITALALVCALQVGCNSQRPSDGANASGKAGGQNSGWIGGIAMLSDAKPGAQAGIQVYLAGTSYSARTDPNGNYLIGGIPRGEYTVMADKTGYQDLTVGKADVYPDVHTQEHPLVMTDAILERAGSELATSGTASGHGLGSIIGQVRLSGAPSSENVRVRIEGQPQITVSDDTGTYQFVNVDPGTYTLQFSKPGYSSNSLTVTVPSGDVAQAQDVVLHRDEEAAAAVPPPPPAAEAVPVSRENLAGDRAIEGTVELLDPAGNRINDYTGVLVAIENSDYVVTPEDQGAFRFAGLAPGVYRVLASVNNAPPQAQSVDISTTRIGRATFRFGGVGSDNTTSGTGTVIGRIVLPGDQDVPLPDAGGVRVSLIGTQVSATTAQDGRFKLASVPAGQYSLEAAKQDFESYREDGLALPPGDTLDLGDIVLEPRRDYPKVVSTTPANNATNVEVNMDMTVVVKFSKPMNTGTVKSALKFDPPAAARMYMGKEHRLSDDHTLVIVFSNMDERIPIKFSTNYRFLIGRQASDTNGLGMKQDFLFSFRTGAPGITGTYPRNGDPAAFINGGSPIVIFFNTKIRHDGVRYEDFRIRPSSDQIGDFDISEDPRTGWSTIRLRAPLRDDTNYSVTVNNRIRAFSGQPLSNVPYTFRFHTAKPELIGVEPFIHY